MKPPVKPADMPQEVMFGVKWTSPLPPPSVLAAYKEISPEVLERLLTLIEEQAHFNCDYLRTNQAERSKVNRADERMYFFGKACALIVALAGFVLSGCLAYWGYPKIAALLCGGELAALIGGFLYVSHRA
ncbi:MAG: hypothetical protein ACI4YA_00890 [Candidatus Spyradenecus sp.]